MTSTKHCGHLAVNGQVGAACEQSSSSFHNVWVALRGCQLEVARALLAWLRSRVGRTLNNQPVFKGVSAIADVSRPVFEGETTARRCCRGRPRDAGAAFRLLCALSPVSLGLRCRDLRI